MNYGVETIIGCRLGLTYHTFGCSLRAWAVA